MFLLNCTLAYFGKWHYAVVVGCVVQFTANGKLKELHVSAETVRLQVKAFGDKGDFVLIFITAKAARRLRESGMARIVNQHPYILRLNKPAKNYERVVEWTKSSGMKELGFAMSGLMMKPRLAKI